MNVLVVPCQQFNVNDNSYKVLDIYFSNGDKVRRNDLLFDLDSSKAVLDIESEGDGYFYTRAQKGLEVSVGETLYIISHDLINDPAVLDGYFILDTGSKGKQNEAVFTKVVTKNAQRLLIEHGLSETDFSEEVITEEVVNKFLKANTKPSLVLENANLKKIKRIAFIGAGQGLIQALDIVFESSEFIPCLIYDDTAEKQGMEIFNIPVAGPVDVPCIIDDFNNNKFDVIINTVSVSIPFRKKIYEALTAQGIPFANLVHPTAYIGFNNLMGTGNIILTHVSFGPCTQIGNDNFISARCNIEHHNQMGDHCTFGPGVMTSGNVIIGSEVKFGTGVFIEPRLKILDNSIIASGCIINRDIPQNVVAYTHGVKLSFKNLND
jgi:acetyltransferase-like isoleucine patch superfamily enzyme